MAIRHIELKDFLVFRGVFTTDFCEGVNVVIGGNGTGKTTLLKVLYRLCNNGKNNDTGKYFHMEWTPFTPNTHPFEYIRLELVNNDVKSRISVNNVYADGMPPDNNHICINGEFVGFNPDEFICEYTNTPPYKFNRLSCDMVCFTENYSIQSSVFIPSTNLIAHSKGFIEMIDDYEMAFDITQVEVIRNAKRPITKLELPNCKKVLSILTKTIGGEVSDREGTFYLEKTNGEAVEFSLEASGITRLGTLWKLLRNGLLESGTVLIWDEPENSLNPELIPVLVDILLELSRNGVQIFIATHSELLASYFTVNRLKDDDVLFTSLYKDGEQIKSNSNDRFDLLNPNHLTIEPVRLYEKKLDKVFGDE